MEVSTNVKIRKGLGRPTLQKCLVILGAKPEEVYNSGYKPMTYRNDRPATSIRERYTDDELNDWVERLHDEAIVKFHPDKHLTRTGFYNAKCQEVGQAYLAARKILDPVPLPKSKPRLFYKQKRLDQEREERYDRILKFMRERNFEYGSGREAVKALGVPQYAVTKALQARGLTFNMNTREWR